MRVRSQGGRGRPLARAQRSGIHSVGSLPGPPTAPAAMSRSVARRLAAVASVAAALLLPPGIALAQQNPDVEVLAQLRKAGSDLRKPHEMEFVFTFPAQAGAVRVVSKLTVLGYAAESKQLQKGGEWLVIANRTMVPGEAELVGVRKQLSEMARAERGEYQGWGTRPVK